MQKDTWIFPVLAQEFPVGATLELAGTSPNSTMTVLVTANVADVDAHLTTSLGNFITSKSNPEN
jgi:hypothetical protein